MVDQLNIFIVHSAFAEEFANHIKN